MRAILQRVSRASVAVDGRVVGDVGRGYVALVGVAPADSPEDARALADKIVGLRLFADSQGKMNRSLVEVTGAVLVVSQFTLLADVRKGRRPSFVGAASPELAASLVEEVAENIRSHGITVSTGVFGAHMEVDLVNDGPVTLVLDTADGRVV